MGVIISCLLVVAAGVSGHHTAPLAWSVSSRWPFILESFVQTGCFRVGPAMLPTGWHYFESAGFFFREASWPPCIPGSGLECTRPGVEAFTVAHHSRNC